MNRRDFLCHFVLIVGQADLLRADSVNTKNPILITKVEPTYSDEAMRARYQGSILLSAIVDSKGKPQDIRILRPLGLGLDENAEEAVRKWRFRPALAAGKPISKKIYIEMLFRLDGKGISRIIRRPPPILEVQ